MTDSIQQDLFDSFDSGTPQDVSSPDKTGKADMKYVQTEQLLTKPTGFMNIYDFTLNPYSGCSFGCTYCYAAFFSRDAEKQDTWGYWVQEYLERYRQFFGLLDNKLRHRGLPPSGEGKDGFAPPF